MTRRQWVLGICLGVATWLAAFGNKTSDGAVIEAAPYNRKTSALPTPAPVVPPATVLSDARLEQAARAGMATARALSSREPTILAILPRKDLAGIVRMNRTGAELFRGASWDPPPPPPSKPAAPLPPPAPVAPQFPYTYLGKKLEDSAWEVYLARGDQTFVVRPQTILEGNYRVESIKPPLVTLTYIPLNQMQTLIIEGTE